MYSFFPGRSRQECAVAPLVATVSRSSFGMSMHAALCFELATFSRRRIHLQRISKGYMDTTMYVSALISADHM